MSRRHDKHDRSNRADAPAAHDSAEQTVTELRSPLQSAGLRSGLLGGVAMLLVARPLIPSDGGPWIGDGQGIIPLWIVLVALWGVASLARPRFEFRFGRVDAAMLGLVGWWTASAWLAMSHGAPRPALNMLWEGFAALAAFFLLRQLIADAREARALVAVMIGLAVACSALAYYQAFVTMPANRAYFARDPAAFLREAGVEPPPEDSPEFKYAADRINSPEPISTFALTNSLAAFLAPWMVVTLGAAAVSRWRRDLRPVRVVLVFVCGLAIAGALLLTHSRSAWIGAGAGIGLIALWSVAMRRGAERDGKRNSASPLTPGPSPAKGRGERARPGRARGLLVLVVIVGVAIAAVGGTAIVRPDLLARATRSFSFRIDYWRATARMIADNPWFGCGPGNFKEAYTQYKLPEASEEITDPHNFLLEVAACGGLPAAGLLLALFAGFFRRVGPRWRADCPPVSGDSWRWLLGGGALGFCLAWVWSNALGYDRTFLETLGLMGAAAVVVAALLPWIRSGTMPPRLLGIGAVVLLVALLAIGGMTFAGVAGTFWILIALGLCATDGPAAARRAPRWVGVIFVAGLLALGFMQYQSCYEAVLNSTSALRTAKYELARASRPSAEANQQLAAAEVNLKLAASADPLAVEPRRMLAQYYLRTWEESGPPGRRNANNLQRFKEWIGEAIARDPQAAELWHDAAVGWREAFEATHEAEYGRQALAAARRAVKLYPTHPGLQLELAQILAETGAAADARRAAREALRLNDLLPPEDKKLNALQRQVAEQLAQEAAPKEKQPSADRKSPPEKDHAR